MKFLLAGIALTGHLAIGTILLNRLHATALPYWFIKLIDKVWILWHLLTPVVWLVWIVDESRLGRIWPLFGPLIYFHLVVCAAAAISLIPGWLHRSLTRQTSPLQLSNDTRVVNIVQTLGHRPISLASIRWLSAVPMNEILTLHVNEKTLIVPRLDPRLVGLTMTHLSDLHFTGTMTKDFHNEVVRQANALNSDMIAITGDLIDKRKCMSWLGEILGKLTAPHGVYFVLGNHDLRVRDEDGIRRELTRRGLIDLGGKCAKERVRNCEIVLAGNELPWFLPAADMRDCPPARDETDPLRILLSHAPDQLPWAKRNQIDLMLAGHTHGGQIQLPILGPILSPSRFGVRYCSGSFYEAPTLMHVSRGVSGTRYVRYQAPPELTKLVLVREDFGTTNEG